MLDKNPLRERLSRGDVVYGAISGFASPDLVEMLAYGGADFVIIDAEHGAIGIEMIQMLVTAARAARTVPIVRVSTPESRLILRALDVGAFGVHISTVSTAQEAERSVQAARYFPRGKRGLFGSSRASQYGTVSPAEYLEWANTEPLVIIAIENVDGFKNLGEILAVPGIDLIFIGPADLSQSLGIPFQSDNPLLINTMSEIIERTRAAGLYVGTNVANADQAKLWTDKGVQFVTFGANGVISRALRTMLQSLKVK